MTHNPCPHYFRLGRCCWCNEERCPSYPTKAEATAALDALRDRHAYLKAEPVMLTQVADRRWALIDSTGRPIEEGTHA